MHAADLNSLKIDIQEAATKLHHWNQQTNKRCKFFSEILTLTNFNIVL